MKGVNRSSQWGHKFRWKSSGKGSWVMLKNICLFIVSISSNDSSIFNFEMHWPFMRCVVFTQFHVLISWRIFFTHSETNPVFVIRFVSDYPIIYNVNENTFEQFKWIGQEKRLTLKRCWSSKCVQLKCKGSAMNNLAAKSKWFDEYFDVPESLWIPVNGFTIPFNPY